MADMMSSMGNSGASTGTGGAAPAMQMFGTLLSAYGQHQQGAGANDTGQAQLQLARFQAAQMRENAGNELAASQRSAEDVGKNAEYVASRALATAAASGGGASDPTVIHVIAGIAAEGAYRKSLALYSGEERARGMNKQADATMYGGQLAARSGAQAQSNYNLAAMGTLAKGGASLFSKYGQGGPSENTANLQSWSASQSGYSDPGYDGP